MMSLSMLRRVLVWVVYVMAFAMVIYAANKGEVSWMEVALFMLAAEVYHKVVLED